ncbi:hypothetical protein F2Q70_00037820 [Brassica cretica]|uniref:Exportin-1 C-terminal domain-containing protein n=1 Tax=Brassica cretica TaxID=69181 RepID=A0A8S9GLJ7_BRACR|nr:hypothetical protein F2Q68_00033269 [Brassica cretica]KAF2587038.1 hypothetical protein F2Q70_00037820 [Brassica cretica]
MICKSLTETLWDASTVLQQYPNSAAFVLEYTIKLLSSSFLNMTTSVVTQFVNGLYESRSDIARFKDNIRDFLVQSKEFSAQDNKDLYAEEAAAQLRERYTEDAFDSWSYSSKRDSRRHA